MKEKRASKKNVFRRIAVCLFLASLPVLFTSCITALLIGMAVAYDESTADQMKDLRKMPEIEEFVITYDDDDFIHDGTNYNRYDLYLIDDGFLKVRSLTGSMSSKYFKVEAIGGYSVEVQREDEKYLTGSDLSYISGKEIKDLQDVIDNYSVILTLLKVGARVENDGMFFDVVLSPLDKSVLAVREKEFLTDLKSMPHVVSVEKLDFYETYKQYYKYSILMDDGIQFEMTLSTVYRGEDSGDYSSEFFTIPGSLWLANPRASGDGSGYSCDFFITSYNGEETKHVWLTSDKGKHKVFKPYESWRFADDTGIKVKSYRDLFYNYEAFKKSIETFIMAASE